jgi:ABC-type phosphate transport system substrate-binding protein
VQQIGNNWRLNCPAFVQILNRRTRIVAKKNTAVAMVASTVIGLLLAGAALAQAGRDDIYIVGSPTVYPFSTVVAPRFGRATEFKTPKVESTGSGLKLFCDGGRLQDGSLDQVTEERGQGPLQRDLSYDS